MRCSLEVSRMLGGGEDQGMVEFRGQPLGLSTLKTPLLSFTWRTSTAKVFISLLGRYSLQNSWQC